MSQINESESKYNDLHTAAIGYLNRGRTVNPNQGKPYESVSFTALTGKVTDPKYVYHDCTRVIGKALDKYLLLKDDINDGSKKVFVRAILGDGYPDSYVTKDKQTGAEVRRHVVKCRMLGITFASIDGQEVQFELDDDDDQSQDTPQQNVAGDHKDAPSNFNDEQDEFVKLDRNDPEFLAKESKLKTLGYYWDTSVLAWHKPAA